METAFADALMAFKIVAYAAFVVAVFFLIRFVNKSDQNYKSLKSSIGNILDRLTIKETYCATVHKDIDKTHDVHGAILHEVEKTVNRHEYDISRSKDEIKHQADKIYHDAEILTSIVGRVGLTEQKVLENTKDIDNLDTWRQKHELDMRGGLVK